MESREYTVRELVDALPHFKRIWDGDGNTEINPMPENVELTVYCCSTKEEDRGFAERVKTQQLGLNAFIAHSWILQTDLDKLLNQ